MSIVCDQFDVEPGWSRVYTFDFTDAHEIACMGESIATAAVTCSNNDGALTIGTPTIAPGQVQVQLTIGDGATQATGYQVTCTPNFSGPPSGQTVSLTMVLIVNA